MDGRELSDLVELEFDLDRLSAGVVPPADPALRAIVIVIPHFEVIRTRPAVCQLSQAALQLPVPVAVVGGVEEFPSITPFITLGHRVGYHAVCGKKGQGVKSLLDGLALNDSCKSPSFVRGHYYPLMGAQRRVDFQIRHVGINAGMNDPSEKVFEKVRPLIYCPTHWQIRKL